MDSYPRFKGDLYRFQYWSNNKLILDMFPAKIGTEGVLFDIISKKIYKSGNVPFTPGTDINEIDLNSISKIASFDSRHYFVHYNLIHFYFFFFFSFFSLILFHHHPY